VFAYDHSLALVCWCLVWVHPLHAHPLAALTGHHATPHAPAVLCVDPGCPYCLLCVVCVLLQSRPGATGDSLFIVALTGTRARAWYDTMFVNSAVIAPPLPLPATAAGTLLPNKPSPVVHSVRSPMEIRVSVNPKSVNNVPAVTDL
jgi:hypothetical protein